MANLATKAGVEGKSRLTIHTPLLKISKAAIIKTGLALGLDYALTWSCYDPRYNDGHAAAATVAGSGSRVLPKPAVSDPILYAVQ